MVGNAGRILILVLLKKKFLKSHPPQTAEPLETYFDASLRITKFMPFCVDRKSQKSSISL
jgi:hypothetical protein